MASNHLLYSIFTHYLKKIEMLIIGRKEGQSFTLILPSGDTVEVTLKEYAGSKTKVSIDAPKDVVILRNELL